MTTPSQHAVNPRYQLLDRVTGSRHSVTYGSQLLANVVNGPRPLAGDAALPNGKTGARNTDAGNSNFLRGGYGNMNNHHSNGYNSRDQEMFEDPVDPEMSGNNGDPAMPIRGCRDPATIWSYVNGDANAPLDADTLLTFLDAALSQFDEDERARFFSSLSDEFFARHEVSPSNGNRDNMAGTPNQQARTTRNGARRSPAQDRAAVRGTFFDRFPDARRITVMG